MSHSTALGFTGTYTNRVASANPLGHGYRFYLPGLMRFNAPDSLSPFGAGGVNLFAYGANDPINHADPSGHAPLGWLDTMRIATADVVARTSALGRTLRRAGRWALAATQVARGMEREALATEPTIQGLIQLRKASGHPLGVPPPLPFNMTTSFDFDTFYRGQMRAGRLEWVDGATGTAAIWRVNHGTGSGALESRGLRGLGFKPLVAPQTMRRLKKTNSQPVAAAVWELPVRPVPGDFSMRQVFEDVPPFFQPELAGGVVHADSLVAWDAAWNERVRLWTMWDGFQQADQQCFSHCGGNVS